jgi:hypothetical protein
MIFTNTINNSNIYLKNVGNFIENKNLIISIVIIVL